MVNLNYRRLFKATLWDDFERGYITEEILTDYFKLMNNKSDDYVKGLYESYHVLVLKLGILKMNEELRG